MTRRRPLDLVTLALNGIEHDQRCGMCGERFRVMSGHQVALRQRETRDYQPVFVCSRCARQHDADLSMLADLSVVAIRFAERRGSIDAPSDAYGLAADVLENLAEDKA